MRSVFRSIMLVLEIVAWYMVGLWVRSTNKKLREAERQDDDELLTYWREIHR